MSRTKDRFSEIQQLSNGKSNTSLNEEHRTDENEINKTFQTIDIIREWINDIKANIKRADYILQSNSFIISKELQTEIDSIFTNNASISYKINTKLKEFEKDLQNSKEDSSTTFRIKNLQYQSLKQSFSDVLKESSDCLEFHRNKKKELLQKSLKAVGKYVVEEELESLLDENQLQTFTNNYIAETAEAKRQLTDIEERHKELLKIEQHLSDVRDLFMKLAILIDQQQEAVDRIEYHAGIATGYVEHGAVDIGKGAKKKTQYRKRKIYCAIGLLIIAVLVIIVILA